MLNICKSTKIFDDIKCSLCEKFLSVAPIYCNGTETICGRCSFINKDNMPECNRQYAYEAVAKHMKFPCSNMMYGCEIQLLWKDVKEHENNCIFKKLNCPLQDGEAYNLTRCRWVGSGPKLNEHLETVHTELINKKPGDIDFVSLKSSAMFFVKVSKQLMMIVVKFEPPEKYNCMVMTNGTSCKLDDYRYQLELQDEDKRNSLILRRNRLEDAIGMEENLMDPDKLIVIDLAVIRTILKNPKKITGRFGILKKSKREVWSQNHPQQNDMFDENFLRELECPICKCYLTPPIFICAAGHSICEKCREQINLCPSCRQPFQDGRNYALEKLTTVVNYPCVYRDAGCTVMMNPSALKEHEKECSFLENKCFLKCSVAASVQNMFLHLSSAHADSILAAGDLHLIECGAGDYHYFAMCYGSDIFRLVIDTGDEDIARFALHQYGVEECNYRYEVEILSFCDNTQKVSILNECVPMRDDEDEMDNCITFPMDMIQNFISEQDLIFFKIHLRREC